jgi:catechol 2,3-dioxygenase-like lactoylglutathione lyase family enzyme
MANSFGADILIQAPDPQKAALFYVNHLGFETTDKNPEMIGFAWSAHQLIHRARPAVGAGFGSHG